MQPVPSIHGMVCDSAKEPVLGAKILVAFAEQGGVFRLVSFEPEVPRSRTDGHFNLDFPGPAFKHFIVIHPDYAPATYPMPSLKSDITCMLEQGHAIGGKVSLDGKHHHVATVQVVSLEDSPINGLVAKDMTDIDGNFTVEHLAAGRYEISVTYPNDGTEMPVHREEINVPVADAMPLDIQFDSTTGVWHSKMQDAPVPAAV